MEAAKAGSRWAGRGGKRDDITVVVAFIIRALATQQPLQRHKQGGVVSMGRGVVIAVTNLARWVAAAIHVFKFRSILFAKKLKLSRKTITKILISVMIVYKILI